MPTALLARSCGAAAALGAAIVGVGVAGPVLHGAAGPLALPVSVAVLAVCVAQGAWALAALAATRTPAPRVTATVGVAATLGWLAAAAVMPAGPHGGRLSAALAALLCAAATLGVALAARAERTAHPQHLDTETDADAGRAPSAASAWLQVAVLLPVAVLVAAAVTAGLAAGPAGDGAMNHMAGM